MKMERNERRENFKVPLVAALTAYKELRADDTLTILIPHQPLFPMSRIHVPVFLQSQVGQNVAVFIVRYKLECVPLIEI